jgi:hypothetical protein
VTSTTCTSNPPPPSKADASEPVAKVFMLSRINGILLNDPSPTSLLNRSTGQAGPLTTAMAGGAMNRRHGIPEVGRKQNIHSPGALRGQHALRCERRSL